MSKEKPETDDIFEDRYGKKIRIDDRTHDIEDCFFVYILVFDIGSGKEYIENDIVSLDVLKNCTYLGKSKANVGELFDVKGECL